MLVQIEFEKQPILFDNPEEIISTYRPEDVPLCFEEMEKAVKDGYYLAGFISYEAGYALEDSFDYKQGYDFPLIYMGKYKGFKETPLVARGITPGLKNLKINIEKNSYFKNIDFIKSQIEKGETYQITYCLKMLFEVEGSRYKLFRHLFNLQNVPYPAYLENEQFKILSLSPELFMKKTGGNIITKPMKGTWRRGINPVDDFICKWQLHFDKKNRAENVMIADLLRNDLGRIGKNIAAPKLFEVARYNTLFQMTSTVTSDIDKDISLYKLFKALHPSGSVTGAPKVRAMEIIRKLEREDRKIYTGAIGYITPQKDLCFNVPIRTLLVQGNKGEMGIGGGIVWDSTPEGEWDECMLKGSFLESARGRNRTGMAYSTEGF